MDSEKKESEKVVVFRSDKDKNKSESESESEIKLVSIASLMAEVFLGKKGNDEKGDSE